MCRMAGNFLRIPFSRMVNLYHFTGLHFRPLCTITIKVTVVRENFVVKDFRLSQNDGNFLHKYFRQKLRTQPSLSGAFVGHENHQIHRATYAQIQQIHYKLLFTLSNKVQRFKHEQSLGLCNAMSTCGQLYSPYMAMQDVHMPPL